MRGRRGGNGGWVGEREKQRIIGESRGREAQSRWKGEKSRGVYTEGEGKGGRC